MTGPASDSQQMFANYFYNALASLLYLAVIGRFWLDWDAVWVSAADAILTLCLFFFSLSCSFTDPGIVTLKTRLVAHDEELGLQKPSDVVAGEEFYMSTQKEAVLLNLPD